MTTLTPIQCAAIDLDRVLASLAGYPELAQVDAATRAAAANGIDTFLDIYPVLAAAAGDGCVDAVIDGLSRIRIRLAEIETAELIANNPTDPADALTDEDLAP